MIDPRELRLGNLLQNERGEIVEVKEILEDHINRYFDFVEGYKPEYEFKDLSYIPLAEEWLEEKLGFIKNDIWWENENICLIWDDIHKEWFLNSTEREYDPELKYVHQLQNLYFDLKRKELTIKE